VAKAGIPRRRHGLSREDPRDEIARIGRKDVQTRRASRSRCKVTVIGLASHFNGHAPRTSVVYPPTGSRAMNTPPTLVCRLQHSFTFYLEIK